MRRCENSASICCALAPGVSALIFHATERRKFAKVLWSIHDPFSSIASVVVACGITSIQSKILR